ncbi:hypothetical protein JET18_16370 [Chryseobacterium sp. L7]|uniref:Uncharacterized protein n=1 Tax=Chryseobacterium endalhagicum TaxID=2797638 RepID=A0ABS1QK33_9FLAO|nr:hypothetical protein [Chryseobacterium endalhagicum]MBL1222429.1 hypothetical protein [Chryseobacterium endalhagicum]
MTRENLHNDIQDFAVRLIKMTEDRCWNKISHHLTFIISDFNEFGENIYERGKVRNKINRSKKPQSLEAVIETLKNEYDDLYDVNLYIFKALKNETIIEIQYYRKSNMEADYFEVIKDYPTMLHAKINHPKYRLEGHKFDINWESGGLRHLRNSLVYEIRYRLTSKLGKKRKSI